MSGGGLRFGQDSWLVPAVLRRAGDWRRVGGPDWIAVPCRVRRVAGGDGKQTGAGERGPARAGVPGWQVTLPRAPSLVEFRALASGLGGGGGGGFAGSVDEALLFDVQFRRQPPRMMVMPGGGQRWVSIPEQFRLYRFNMALRRIRAAEPTNAQLTFVMEPSSLPSEAHVLELEREAGLAEARVAGGPAPAGPVNRLPGVPLPTYDIVMPNGRPVGMPFRNAEAGVQTVFASEFERISAELLQGATQIARAGYRGRWFRRADGTEFGFRVSPRSGLTLDVRDPRLINQFRIPIQ